MADLVLRQLPDPPRSAARRKPRERAGTILQLRLDAFAAVTRLGTRLFLPERNMPLFPPENCLRRSGVFSLHWFMVFSL